MPISRSFAFTCGLWMISPARKSRRSGNFAPRLVRVLYRALHAVAEAELLRQTNGDVLDDERVVLLAQGIDDPAAVVRRQLVLDVGLEAETLSEVGSGLVGAWDHARNLVYGWVRENAGDGTEHAGAFA